MTSIDKERYSGTDIIRYHIVDDMAGLDYDLHDNNVVELTGNNVFAMSLEDRTKVAEALFRYFRKHGFPHISATQKKLLADWKKLKDTKNTVLKVRKDDHGTLHYPNKNLAGGLIVRHFQSRQFYSTAGNGNKDISMLDAFSDDVTLRKVIYNRMQITFKEKFNIHGAMLRQGFRSTRSCSTTSIFNCLIARHVYDNFCPENGVVYDISSGFGHRMLGALASSKKPYYIGTDPWLAVQNTNLEMAKYVDGSDRVQLLTIGSESEKLCSMIDPAYIGNIDLVFSSPPYWDVEVYDNAGEGQAWKPQADFQKQFIEHWWEGTLKNIKKLLKKDSGIVCINMTSPMVDILVKHAVDNHGFVEYNRHYLELSVSHMANKKSSGRIKKGEPFVFMRLAT